MAEQGCSLELKTLLDFETQRLADIVVVTLECHAEDARGLAPKRSSRRAAGLLDNERCQAFVDQHCRMAHVELIVEVT